MQTINQLREDHSSVCKAQNGRTAVIVKTEYKPRKFSLGVQFWDAAMIAFGASVNADRTTSTFLENL